MKLGALSQSNPDSDFWTVAAVSCFRLFMSANKAAHSIHQHAMWLQRWLDSTPLPKNQHPGFQGGPRKGFARGRNWEGNPLCLAVGALALSYTTDSCNLFPSFFVRTLHSLPLISRSLDSNIHFSLFVHIPSFSHSLTELGLGPLRTKHSFQQHDSSSIA